MIGVTLSVTFSEDLYLAGPVDNSDLIYDDIKILLQIFLELRVFTSGSKLRFDRRRSARLLSAFNVLPILHHSVHHSARSTRTRGGEVFIREY